MHPLAYSSYFIFLNVRLSRLLKILLGSKSFTRFFGFLKYFCIAVPILTHKLHLSLGLFESTNFKIFINFSGLNVFFISSIFKIFLDFNLYLTAVPIFIYFFHCFCLLPLMVSISRFSGFHFYASPILMTLFFKKISFIPALDYVLQVF